MGVFLIDLCCLGVKNAFATLLPSRAVYEEGLRQQIMSSQRLVNADPNLAAKIIREGIAYARELGFNPHRDYAEAAPLLADADPDASNARIPLGMGGKPYFIAGPNDNVQGVLARLTKAVGPGNFRFTAALAGPPAFFAEDDEA